MNNTAAATTTTTATVVRVVWGWVGCAEFDGQSRAVTSSFRTSAEATEAVADWNASFNA